MTSRPAEGTTSVRARAASIPRAMPPFISSTPGPKRHRSRTSSGILSICPIGQTVSKCPMSSTWSSPVPNSARRWSPTSGRGRRVTTPPIAVIRCASSAPHRSTAVLAVVGDSRRASAMVVSSTTLVLGLAVAEQAFRCAGRRGGVECHGVHGRVLSLSGLRGAETDLIMTT